MSAPDLLAESRQREEAGERAWPVELALRTPHTLPAGGYRLVWADELPAPYGPDPTVFGPRPRTAR